MDKTPLALLELAYYEAQFAFEGLADENVWRRPAPTLHSVGELAGHMAYWEAIRLAGNGEDLAQCRVQSPLVDNRFRYYPASLQNEPGPEHLAMKAADVYSELMRVHRECLAHLEATQPAADAPIPGCPSGFTYGQYLEYAVFHVSYHVGQMYSARHLLGETTPDN